MYPPPMGHHVCKFFAKRGDEHGDDNDKSKDDHDYADGCERMDYASGDGCEPRGPGAYVCNFFGKLGDECGDDNDGGYVAGAQDDDGSADGQYGNDNFKDDKSKDDHGYGDGYGSGDGGEAKGYGTNYRHRNSFETMDYDRKRYDGYVKRARARAKRAGAQERQGSGDDHAYGKAFATMDYSRKSSDVYVGKTRPNKSYGSDLTTATRRFKRTDEGHLYSGDLRELQLLTGTGTKNPQLLTGTLRTDSATRQRKFAWTCSPVRKRKL